MSYSKVVRTAYFKDHLMEALVKLEFRDSREPPTAMPRFGSGSNAIPEGRKPRSAKIFLSPKIDFTSSCVMSGIDINLVALTHRTPDLIECQRQIRSTDE